jgi:hypothetical protein
MLDSVKKSSDSSWTPKTDRARLLEHLSPLGWNHINLLGRYQFSNQRQWSLNPLRPLQTQAEIDADTRDDQDEG